MLLVFFNENTKLVGMGCVMIWKELEEGNEYAQNTMCGILKELTKLFLKDWHMGLEM